jgi:ankyrin repeat protein
MVDLFKLAENNKIEGFKQDNKININIVDEFGFNLLLTSISNNSIDVSKYLIINGIDLNFQDGEGKTALHYLCHYPQQELIELLTEKTFNPNLKDVFGNTPLWTAIFKNNLNIINLLLEKGADINSVNNVGKSPLWLANDMGLSSLLKK